jgi:hypothetical protein
MTQFGAREISVGLALGFTGAQLPLRNYCLMVTVRVVVWLIPPVPPVEAITVTTPNPGWRAEGARTSLAAATA